MIFPAPHRGRALNHVHAVAAAAHHQHAFARLHPRPVARGPDARRHAAGNEAGKIERDVFVDTTTEA